MAPTPVISVNDGQRITVSSLLKSPTLIPRRILRMLDQQFLVDAILRDAGGAPGGAVIFYESTPLFADADPAIVEEFGEIPAVTTSLGQPRVAKTVKRAMAMKVSQEMINRNNIDLVNTQQTQIRNTMIRAWEDAFLAIVMAHPLVPHVAATTTWDSVSSTIRKDVNSARHTVKIASTDVAGNNRLGFVPNTLVIGVDTETDFLDSDEVSRPYIGNIADENLQYTGKLPNKFISLDVLVSWRLPAGKAIVLERKTIGGISDERSLQATPMYENRDTETWRSNILRQSAIFMDQPLAAAIIDGV